MVDEEAQDSVSETQDRKGKRRATVQEEPSERTPLLTQLAGTSHLPWQVVNDSEEAAQQSSRRRLWAKLTKVFLISLSLSILFLVALALLAWSYVSRASDLTPQDIINKHLVFKGPDSLEVINITADGGIWLNVRGRLGVDVGDALGLNTSPDDGILDSLWKGIGRKSVQTLGNVSLNLSTISILPELYPYHTLAKVDVPPLQVSLSVDPPRDGSWLTAVTIPALVHPTTNVTVIAHFLKDAWKHGYFAVRADVDNVYVRGGSLDKPSWRTKFHGRLSNIQASLRLQVPLIPGLPHPGGDIPLPKVSELITLKSFSLYSTSSNLNLVAEASVIDPAPDTLEFTSPPLKFTASLPTNASSINIASVTASPFSLTHPNITIPLHGSILPISSTNFPTLSSFLTRFLSGESNPVLISLDSMPGLSIEAEFPGPNPRPRILQNVTIQNMKLKPMGGQFLASGTVFARIVLPKGMDVGLNISMILPDVLIFDGEVPSSDDYTGRPRKSKSPPPPGEPLPDPLPEHAFGHIRPEDWLEARSRRDDDSEAGGDDGAVYAVTAKVVDVPLEVLPGRQKDFSNFVSKVIFNADGAVAGIQGTAAVRVEVEGLSLGSKLSNHLDLGGLPFQGSVRINKKSLFTDQMRVLKHVLETFPFARR